MDLCDYKQITQLLAANGFHFSKSKGQNFLTASWVPEQIAEASGAGQGIGVVEIGPGFGCLTQQLALRAEKVLSYEVDESLKPVLAQTLAGIDNVEILFADAMRRDLAADVKDSFSGMPVVMCANLPYNITTPVLTKAFEAGCFERITVMIQKEVAQRIAAKPNTAEYGAFSVLSQWYTEPELLFSVGPECFVPRPKVTSEVITMRRRETPPAAVSDEKAFFRVVRAAFNMRRKTLVNTLEGVCGKENARAALCACGLDERVRGEALSIAEFAALSNELAKY